MVIGTVAYSSDDDETDGKGWHAYTWDKESGADLKDGGGFETQEAATKWARENGADYIDVLDD